MPVDPIEHENRAWLVARIRKLEAALRVYANHSNWSTDGNETTWQGPEDPCRLSYNLGWYVAEKALEE